MKILVLEDVPDEFYLIKRILESADYVVDHCKDGEEVDQYFKENRSTDLPDLLIFDIKIGEHGRGEDGIDIAARYYSRIKKPLMILTKYFDDKSLSEKARNKGLPTAYFTNKMDLLNSDIFLEKVAKCVADFTSENPREQVARIDHRIGLIKNEETYEFIDGNEVVYLEADAPVTHIYLEDKRKLTVSASLTRAIQEMQSHFNNIIEIDRGYAINPAKIKLYNRSDKIIYFFNGEHIKITGEGDKRLRAKSLLFRLKE